MLLGPGMTDVTFHFNVAERIPYLCRLLRKAVSAGKPTLVLLPEGELPLLDQALWTHAQESFLPHAVCGQAGQAVLKHSLVWLAVQEPDLDPALPRREVLVNTLWALPEGWARYERVLELVGLDDAERQHARTRWRLYTDAGLTLHRHDAAAPAPAAA
jgi:DNA polymerase-3 subunit chi